MQNFTSHIALDILQRFTSLNTLTKVHAKTVASGSNDNKLLTKLILSYLFYDKLDTATHVFQRLTNPNSYLWNVLIRGYAKKGMFVSSLRLFSEMVRAGVRPDKFTFPFALKSCAGLSDTRLGKLVHGQLVCCGCESDVFIGAGLVDMYAKSGDVGVARLVFDRMHERDLVSWTTMISGYAHNGSNVEALECIHSATISSCLLLN